METEISLSPAQVIEDCARDSYAGTRNFAEIVGALAGVGVESYYADCISSGFRTRTECWPVVGVA